MNDWIVGTVFGLALVLFGVIMLRRHWLAWQIEKEEPGLEFAERKYFFARYRRRMQTSGLVVLLGILIPIGDALIPWQRFPGLFAIYWGGILLVAVWIILLACGDFVSTRVHSNAALARIQQKKTELEHEAARLRRDGSNGRH